MIAVFILIIQSILFLGHYFVYKTFIKFFGITSGNPLLWARILFFALSLLFTTASILAFRYYGPVARSFYYVGAVWLGTLYWLFFASVLSWLIFGFGKLLQQGRSTSVIAIGLFVIAIITSAYGVWNSYQTKVRHVSVRLDNLPEQWKGRTAVLVADTHMGHIRNVSFGKKVAQLIEAQHPDIVLIPGDFYDGPPTDFVATAGPFGNIKSTFGTYFAPGNHEEFGDSSPLLAALIGAGVHVLNDQMKVVDGLQIIGVGYGSTTRSGTQQKVLESLHVDKSVASILIKHAPTHVEIARDAGITFQVSGHTHRGQVYPMGYITKALYRQFYYGLSQLDSMQVLTTSGVGTWGPPQRVGTNSEIWVITFK